MAAPSRVPTSPTQRKHYSSPPRRSGSWRAERPGETIGAAHPTGRALGNPGPDQGYVLALAQDLKAELVLAPGEHVADVVTGACAVALRRASMFGRGPMREDLEMALTLYGFLGEAAPELVALRRKLFAEVHHTTVHYFAGREIADRVDADMLKGRVEQAKRAVERDWRSAFGRDQ
jgi:hypothetical protein